MFRCSTTIKATKASTYLGKFMCVCILYNDTTKKMVVPQHYNYVCIKCTKQERRHGSEGSGKAMENPKLPQESFQTTEGENNFPTLQKVSQALV